MFDRNLTEAAANLRSVRDQLRSQLSQVERVLASFDLRTRDKRRRVRTTKTGRRNRISSAGKAAISRAAKKRWAAYRREQAKASKAGK